MTSEPAAIDISDRPDVAEFVRMLLAAGEPRELRRGDEVLGVLSPATARRTEAESPASPNLQALEDAAGSLAGLIDAEAMHRANAESRHLSISRRRYR